MPTYIRGCDAKSERSVDQSWISLTKDRSRVPLLPRPDAPSEITALAEPYMLTIQGWGRSIEMPVDARGGKANKRTNSCENHGAAGSWGKPKAEMAARANCWMRAWHSGSWTGKTAAAR